MAQISAPVAVALFGITLGIVSTVSDIITAERVGTKKVSGSTLFWSVAIPSTIILISTSLLKPPVGGTP